MCLGQKTSQNSTSLSSTPLPAPHLPPRGATCFHLHFLPWSWKSKMGVSPIGSLPLKNRQPWSSFSDWTHGFMGERVEDPEFKKVSAPTGAINVGDSFVDRFSICSWSSVSGSSRIWRVNLMVTVKYRDRWHMPAFSGRSAIRVPVDS